MAKTGKIMRNNFAIIILFIALLFAAFDIFWNNKGAPETLLVYILLFSVGLQGIIAGIMHWREKSAAEIAKGIGWMPGSPFQQEVAAADIAFGVLGVLSFFLRDSFLVATVIGSSIMLFLMGVNHAADFACKKNRAPLNSGSVLYFDILMPIVMIALLALWKAGF